MSESDRAQPLLYLGEKRRQVLCARGNDALRRWRQSWMPDATDGFDVTAEPPSPKGFSAPIAGAMTSCWGLELGAQRLAVLLLPHATFAWAVQGSVPAAFDATTSPGRDSLAERLEQAVAGSLLGELCQLDRQAVTASRIAPDAIQDWSFDVRAWILHAKASGGRGLSVLLAAARVEVLVPARAPVTGALDSRHDAVAENTVALRGVVGQTFMSVSELADLAIDDVLVLDQALTEPVTLVSPPTGSAVAAGNLGRVGARRAIKVAGIPAQG
jgi:flagellar motor switch/type III secretory pathway protein FliN